MENIRVLRQIALFKGLKGLDLIQINKIARSIKFKRGERIIEEGNRGECFYIIKSGEVRVLKRKKGWVPSSHRHGSTADAAPGNEEVIAVLSPCEHFGEMSLFDSSPRSASIAALTDCELIEIGGGDLDRLMQENPSLAGKIYRSMIRSLCQRLRNANEHMVKALGLGISI